VKKPELFSGFSTYTGRRRKTLSQTGNSRHCLDMKIRRANERGHAEHGWLDSYHTFSFADYYDPQWMGYRSLRVINDDVVTAGQGFGTHPHRDMEIITYVLSGALEHKDSMGNGSVIRAGDVQYMSAGSGVRHSEFNPSKDEAVHLLQIWIEPDEIGATPRYAEKSFKDSPSGKLNLVASKTGRDGSIAIRQDADLWIAKLEPGQQVTHSLANKRHAWLHVAEGEVSLDGKNLSGGDAAILDEAGALELRATKPTQVLLFDLN
jgi:redox-sensitive bicupin YhaK (pirin superfamily)